MDPDFRLVNAQGWISMNPAVLAHPTVAGLGRDAFAREIASETPTHPLWSPFARVMVREITQAYGGLQHEDLGIGTRTRLIAPDLELIRFFPLDEMQQDAGGQYYFPPGPQARTLSVLLRHQEPEWRVAGVGDHIGYPDWPPRFERIVQPED